MPVTSAFICFFQPRAASSCKSEAGSGTSSVHGPWTEVGINSLDCPAGSLHASFLCLQGGELPCKGAVTEEQWMPGRLSRGPNLVLQVHGGFVLQSSYPLQKCLRPSVGLGA